MTQTLPDSPVDTLVEDLACLSVTKDGYQRPPYEDAEGVYFPNPVLLERATMLEAMGQNGQNLKQLTVGGVRWLFWDMKHQRVEVHCNHFPPTSFARPTPATENAERETQLSSSPYTLEMAESFDAWQAETGATDTTTEHVARTFAHVTRSVEDLVMKVILHPVRPRLNTDVSRAEHAWAMGHLQTFQQAAEYRCVFEIPDWTTCGMTPWTLTVPMQEQMDNVQLHTPSLCKGETILFDYVRCTVAWVRRDGDQYEIRARYPETVLYVQKCILHALLRVVTKLLETNVPGSLPPNAVVWRATYYEWLNAKQRACRIAYHQATGVPLPTGQRGTGRGKGKGRGKGNKGYGGRGYQSRVGKKRQKL
jgi:hypothetical protein